jgi:hypothetical protein
MQEKQEKNASKIPIEKKICSIDSILQNQP